MESKVWFITGASRGFGRLWTVAALKRGDRVVATARNPEALDDLITEFGAAILTLALDVTDHDAIFAAVAEGHRHFGRLDVILCNAGYAYMGAVEELDLPASRANFEANVWGTVSVVQAALPILREQGSGHILTVSSIGGILSFPTGGAYLATKFSIEALSEALAGEVAPFGIKVTIIEPGSYATTFGTSTKAAAPMDIYDPVRKAIRSSFNTDDVGDPSATCDVILKIVDEQEPPLRLVLGSKTIPRFRAVYERRLKAWDEWADLSNAAQSL